MRNIFVILGSVLLLVVVFQNCAPEAPKLTSATSTLVNSGKRPHPTNLVNFVRYSATTTITGIDQPIELEFTATIVTGTPTFSYRKNSDPWVTIIGGVPLLVSVVNNDTLQFQVSGTGAGQSGSIAIRNLSDGNTLLAKISGTSSSSTCPNPGTMTYNYMNTGLDSSNHTFIVPANCSVNVKVWGGGGGSGSVLANNQAGGNGVQSVFNGNLFAGGGAGGGNDSSRIGGAGGTALGGDTNSIGTPGTACTNILSGQGGDAPGGGKGGIAIKTPGHGQFGTIPGGGGGGSLNSPSCGGGGGSGGHVDKTYAPGALSPGSIISMQVGRRGYGSLPLGGLYDGGDGGHGRIEISWY